MNWTFSLLVLFSYLGGACATKLPSTGHNWQPCDALCHGRGGVMEAWLEPTKGTACQCHDDEIFWLEEVHGRSHLGESEGKTL